MGLFSHEHTPEDAAAHDEVYNTPGHKAESDSS